MTDTLSRLAAIVAERRSAETGSSYTAKLIADGPARVARKLGEEAIETIVAALSGDPQQVVAEAADVVYHLVVLLECLDIPIGNLSAELERREAQSGLAEKASRRG